MDTRSSLTQKPCSQLGDIGRTRSASPWSRDKQAHRLGHSVLQAGEGLCRRSEWRGLLVCLQYVASCFICLYIFYILLYLLYLPTYTLIVLVRCNDRGGKPRTLSRSGVDLERTNWGGLPTHLRKVIESRTGAVRSAVTVDEGKNSALASILETESGRVFVKGLEIDDPCVASQMRESAIAPYVQDVSPGILFHVQEHGWNVIGFEYVDGMCSDYTAGSADLAAISDVMCRLERIACPDLPLLKRAEHRWRDYLDDTKTAVCLSGKTLLFTDWNPSNVLIANGKATLVDWAWPTVGAAWIDPACWIQHLIVAGHHPADAETLTQKVPAWHFATNKQLDIFARANARLWGEIVMCDPQPFKLKMSVAAQEWANYRLGMRAKLLAPKRSSRSRTSLL